MGWIAFAICGCSVYFGFKANTTMGMVALANAIANIWTFGIMHNFRREAGVSGGGEQVAILLNMATSVAGIACLIIALVMK